MLLFQQVQAYDTRTQQWSVETPMSGPRHKACAVSIDDHVVVTGGTLLGLGKTKPSWLAEIGSRTASAFDGRQWTKLPPMNRAKVSCSTASSFSNIYCSVLLK